MLAKWNGKLITVSCLLSLTPLGLPHIKKCWLFNMTNSTWKSEFQPRAVFSRKAEWSAVPSENFALSSINKDQHQELKNFLNQNYSRHQEPCRWFYAGRYIYQINYMSSVLISAEAVELKMTKKTLHPLGIK